MGRRRPWLAAGEVVALLAAAGSVQGQTRGGGPGFWLVGLPPEGTNGTVRALSQDGSVAHGHSFGTPGFLNASFSWTLLGGRNDWGIAVGMPWNNVVSASSSSGQIIAGTMSTEGSPERPFRRVGEGPLEDLGTLAPWPRSVAHGMSGDGQIVVGLADAPPTPPVQYGRAWRWTPTIGMQSLGALTPQSIYSNAHAISRDGTTIVGLNINEVLWFQAFTWRAGEGMKALPTLKGTPSGNDAWGVNADGTVIVGSSGTAAGWGHAVRWVNGEVEDLASATLWNKHSTAFAVSDDGEVVGGSYSQSGIGIAFVWSKAAGMQTAKDYLALHGIALPSDCTLEELYTISGDGLTFGGYARHTVTNKTEGFVARVRGGSVCVTDCDNSGQLNIDDFICFQTYFALGDPKADCDASGTLDIDDFICFQTAFVLGC